MDPRISLKFQRESAYLLTHQARSIVVYHPWQKKKKNGESYNGFGPKNDLHHLHRLPCERGDYC